MTNPITKLQKEVLERFLTNKSRGADLSYLYSWVRTNPDFQLVLLDRLDEMRDEGLL